MLTTGPSSAEPLEDINKPKERETASYALEQNIPCGMNKSRGDHHGQGYGEFVRERGMGRRCRPGPLIALSNPRFLEAQRNQCLGV